MKCRRLLVNNLQTNCFSLDPFLQSGLVAHFDLLTAASVGKQIARIKTFRAIPHCTASQMKNVLDNQGNGPNVRFMKEKGKLKKVF